MAENQQSKENNSTKGRFIALRSMVMWAVIFVAMMLAGYFMLWLSSRAG